MTGVDGLFSSLHGYRRSWLRGDLLAGLTVWAVLVPESLAYATIAGVPPVVGLYAAVPALVLYAALGSSRHLVVGPMSATAALSAGIVGTFAAAGGKDYVALTTALALVTGALALVAGLLRLGFLASFISEPVLKGFIVGLALTIIVGQLPKFFGVPKGSGNFFEQAWHLLGQLSHAHGLTVLIGAVSLAVVLGLRRYLPILPGSLIAVLASIAAVALWDLDGHDVDVVGQIQPGLPHLGLPDVGGLDGYLQLAGPAVGLLLVGFAEGLAAAKTYAAREGYEVDADRELLGLGAANLGTGFSSGMVVNGSLSKTAVNGSAGARTQTSGLVVAALTVVTLLFLTGLFERLPEATLAAVVIAAVVELVDVPGLRRLYRVRTSRLGTIYGRAARADFAAAVAALLGVLVFDTLPGLVIGIAVSMILLLYRSSRPQVTPLVRVDTGTGGAVWVDAGRYPDRTPAQGVLVVRVEAPLFFANADHVRARIRALRGPDTHAVVLDAETTPFIDVTAADMLTQLDGDLQRDGCRLVVARDIGQVRDVIDRSQETHAPGYDTVDAAVQALLDEPTPDGTRMPRGRMTP